MTEANACSKNNLPQFGRSSHINFSSIRPTTAAISQYGNCFPPNGYAKLII